MKPNGVLLLGLPVSPSRNGYIEWNIGRIYGNDRLKILFRGWRVLAGKTAKDLIHNVYILQKIQF